MDNTLKIEIKTVIKRTDDIETIQVERRVSDEVTRQIINLHEEAVRQALISLGWTPPHKTKSYNAGTTYDIDEE